MKLIIASNNKGKIREYKDIFEPLGFRVFSQSEENIRLEVEETGSTFEQNAILKARAIYELAHCCVVSDDSGLEVEALGGEPGLYSARYKGLETEHERRLAVLKGLEGSDNRRARFVTCICFIDETGEDGGRKRQNNGQPAALVQGNLFPQGKGCPPVDLLASVTERLLRHMTMGGVYRKATIDRRGGKQRHGLLRR